MSVREVTLRFFRLFLFIGSFGRLEHLICEILESVIVLGLVLSLGVKNVDAIQEDLKFTRLGPVLLVVSRPLRHIDGTVRFPPLFVALG
jgi:uncharacterized membrane protein